MTFSRTTKYVVMIGVAILGLVNVKLVIQSLASPVVYRKDFHVEYLFAKAVLNGVDPYLPLSELANRFIGSVPVPFLPYPAPHPPPVAILSLPFGLLSYEQAAAAWLPFELGCIVASIYLLLRSLDAQPTLAYTLLITLLGLAWEPFIANLVAGQLMTLLLLLLIIAWQALRSGNSILGGAALGCVIALKLMAWPIFIFLLLRKNWRGAGAAAMVVAAANFIAALLMGFKAVAFYYLHIGAIHLPLFRGHMSNISAWTIGWRVFEGSGSPILYGLHSPPLISAPTVAQYVSFIMPLALVAVGLALAYRAYSFNASYGILICVSILVNPVAWSHYLILASIPIVIAGRRLFNLNLPRAETRAAAIIGLLLFFLPPFDLIESLFAVKAREIREAPMVPFAAGLLSLTPLVAILCLLWLVWHLDHIRLTEASQSGVAKDSEELKTKRTS